MQTNTFTVDFASTARAADALPMTSPLGARRKDFRVDFNMAAATTFTLITETLGPRD